jgi:hypothetical protein
MKLKYNENKATYNICGLTDTDVQVIATLMAHVRLGVDHPASDTCHKVGDFLEQNGWQFEDMELVATKYSGKKINDFMLEFV